MSRIGEKINILRNKKGMSKKQLGKKLGVSEKFLTEVESGRKVINEKLIDKMSKIFGEDINDISMNFEDMMEEEKNIKVDINTALKNKDKVNDVWSNALGSILKSIPIYGYDLNKILGKKQVPVVSNKIEGYSADKVLFLQIEDDDMLGFRIAKGDIAFIRVTHEIENNSICLVEYNGERAIRQIKNLGGEKILLINNKGNLRTETVNKKALKVLAKLEKLEIKL